MTFNKLLGEFEDKQLEAELMRYETGYNIAVCWLISRKVYILQQYNGCEFLHLRDIRGINADFNWNY